MTPFQGFYHHASGTYFKKTIEKDDEWKGKWSRNV